MNSHHAIFGLYRPGDSLLHRASAGAKFALIFALSVATLLLRSPVLSLGALLAVVVALLSTRLPARLCFAVPLMFVVLAAAIFGYHLITGHWRDGLVVALNLFACLYASRVLTLTTPAPVLLDGLVRAATPLRVVGVDPERVGLAVALMLRSIPYLFGSFTDVRDAARARGLERNVLAQVSPVVVNAIAYALATGQALAARGLGEAEPDRSPP